MKQIYNLLISLSVLTFLGFSGQAQSTVCSISSFTLNSENTVKITSNKIKFDSCKRVICKLSGFDGNFPIEAIDSDFILVRITIPNDSRYIGEKTLLLMDSIKPLDTTCKIKIGYKEYSFDSFQGYDPIFFNQRTQLKLTGENLTTIKEIQGLTWTADKKTFTTRITQKPTISDTEINMEIVVETNSETEVDKIGFKIIRYKTNVYPLTTEPIETFFQIPLKQRKQPFLTVSPSDLVVDDYKSTNMRLRLSFPDNGTNGIRNLRISSEKLFQVELADFLLDPDTRDLFAWVPINNNIGAGTYYISITEPNDKNTMVADGQFTIKPTPNITSIRRIGANVGAKGLVPEINPFDSEFTLALDGVGLNERNVTFKIRYNDNDRLFKINQQDIGDQRVLKITVVNNVEKTSKLNKFIPAPPFGSYYLYLERKRDTNTICYHSPSASEFKLVEPSKIYTDVSKFVTIENRMTRQDVAKIDRKKNRIEKLKEKLSKHKDTTKCITKKRVKHWEKRSKRIKKQIEGIETFYLENVKSPPNLAIQIDGDKIPAAYGSQYVKVYTGIYQPDKKENTELETKTYPDDNQKENYVVAPEAPEFAGANVRETWESETCKFFNPDNIAPFNKITIKVAHTPGKYTDVGKSKPLIKNYYIKGNFFDHLGITITLPPLMLLGAITKNEETKKCQWNFQVSTLNIGIGIKYIFRNRHNWLPTGHSTGIYFMGMNFGQVHSDSTQALVGEKLIGQGTFTLVGFYELNLFSIERAMKIPVQFGIGFTPVALNNKPLVSAMLGIGINIPIIK